MKDGHVPEETHVEETAQAKFGTPEPAMDRPTGSRQGFGYPTAAHFHHGNAVAFLRQAMRGHASAEAGPDHDEIEIK
jgi:hypothetical protein